MAERDFARNEAPSRPADGAATTLMPVMAILMVALLCFAVGYWLGGAQSGKHKPPSMTSTVPNAEYANLKARFEHQQHEMEVLSDELQKWKSIANRDPSTKLGELQFYKELPKQSVMPAPMPESGDVRTNNAVPKSTKPGQLNKDMPAMHAEAGNDSSQMLANIIGRELKRSQQGKFLIQAGSFRSSAEAEPLRQRLDKAGFSSFTEVVDLESKGRWNRVYVGPFTTRGAAERTKRQLRDKLKIEGLLLKKNG